MIKNNAIWCFLTMLFLCMLFLTISAMGQEIIIEPESFSVELIGGDIVTKDMTVRWTGNDEVICNISTNITSDCGSGEGINVTYSIDSPFNLVPNVDFPIKITINAAIDIMPGVYTIVTNVSCEAEKLSGDDDNGDDGRPPRNIPPIANISAPYQDYINIEITFNGSLSYDPDGDIVSWYWDFSDGTNGTGKIITHIYSNPGMYNITLAVTDNKGAKDTDRITIIILGPNNPPSTPEIMGPTKGSKNIVYNFSAMSTDLDNDSIEYVFDWGDGILDSSEFLSSGTIHTINHTWSSAGAYIIEIYAYDNQTYSKSTLLIILIDICYIGELGYLIDEDSDGIYDSFYNNATGGQTAVEKQDGIYLIDSDGDGGWNYEYNSETNVLNIYIVEEEEDRTPWYALLVLIIIGIISFILIMKNKKKEKDNSIK